MKTDIEIAQEAVVQPISEIAEKAGLQAHEIEPYGYDKAKINLDKSVDRKSELGKLILVTSINPTPAGEGKSTVTVGLADALSLAGKKTMIALREPSLGPVMGLKGGATGGGYSQVIPMADINLHFTGDFHALTSAHNTLAAALDNSIYQGNPLKIDSRRVLWKRVLDINDRALRHTTIGLGGPTSGVPREDGFDITVASELMAVLTLSTDLQDLKKRIEKIVVAYNYDKKPVTVADLGVAGALTVLLKAIKPNLVQTLAHTPAIIHGGPFANIAQGTNSVLATKTALQLADYVVTEAGFGADLGGEKFMDIKVPKLGKAPDAVVVVATVRALKHHGGAALADLNQEDLTALKAGLENLGQNIKAMQRYGRPVLVAVNRFTADTDAEISMIEDFVATLGAQVFLADVWAQGGAGAKNLAQAVVETIDQADADFTPLYQEDAPALEKLQAIVEKIYGGAAVELSAKAEKQLKDFAQYGWDKLPIVMAKTQYSLSDDPKKLGAPKDFTVHIREFVPKLGAGFLVALTGSILTMPGLPKHPAALDIDIDENGQIIGLF